MPKLQNGSKGDSNPGFLDCESGILPLSYRAPQMNESEGCNHRFPLFILLGVKHSCWIKKYTEETCFEQVYANTRNVENA